MSFLALQALDWRTFYGVLAGFYCFPTTLLILLGDETL
jgi:hypothetical protein